MGHFPRFMGLFYMYYGSLLHTLLVSFAFIMGHIFYSMGLFYGSLLQILVVSFTYIVGLFCIYYGSLFTFHGSPLHLLWVSFTYIMGLFYTHYGPLLHTLWVSFMGFFSTCDEFRSLLTFHSLFYLYNKSLWHSSSVCLDSSSKIECGCCVWH